MNKQVVPQPTLVLFDIDGTLLVTGGAGRRAFERALRELSSRPIEKKSPFSFAGMTDRAIARQVLQLLGRRPSDAEVEALCMRYLDALHEELPRSEGFLVLRGAYQLVSELRQQAAYAVGLGTGNFKRGAEAKLSHSGLWSLFSFGGYGCDHEDRAELLRVGAERGAKLLGLRREQCRVIVIGDTVRDVAAAKRIEAESVMVETGGSTREALLRAGAEHVFDALDHPGLRRVLMPHAAPAQSVTATSN